MALKIPAEINKDNAAQVCETINKQARRMKKRACTRKLILTVGCLCFTLISILFCTGLMYHICDQVERDAVDSIPIIRFYAAFAERVMFSHHLPVAKLVIVAAAVQYLVPLAVCIAVSLLVQLLYHPRAAVDTDAEPARAHQLRKAVENLYQDWLVLGDKSGFRIFCNYLFTAYTLYALVMLMVRLGWPGYGVSEIIGGVIVFVLWHLLYKLLLGIYVGIGKLFYVCKNPVDHNLRTKVNAYVQRVDPKAVQEEPAKAPARTEAKVESAASDGIVHIDPFTWTVAYAQSHEEKCGDTAMNYVEIAKESLCEGDYASAAAGLDRAAFALDMLSRVRGGQQYIPYLYANQYAASRVYAFGLGDRSAAKFRLEQAVKNAGNYAVKQYANYESAIRDFKVMNGVLEEFNNGTSLGTLKEYYGSEFPYDILNG